MNTRKIIGKIHLWLGLSTGIVVFIIAVTGALYCFAPEIQEFTQPYTKVVEQENAFLPPSQIQQIAEKNLPGKTLVRIYYGSKTQSVIAWFSQTNTYDYSVYINPYTGQVLKLRNNDEDFLSVVLKIHRTLLIPFGHDIIRWSTVIFLLMLISGIILWWPKNRRRAKQALIVKWRASPKRLNYDLHKVFGFYATWLVIFSVVSGLMFSFKGFANLTYRLTGAKNSIVQERPPLSDTSTREKTFYSPIDQVWEKLSPFLHDRYARIMFVLPGSNAGAILVRANPETRTLYKTDFRYFDRFTGQEINGAYVWGNYSDAQTGADFIRRMNYDIHTGAIFGLPGRIVLFFVSLIVASLPITGFYFWWGKQKKLRRSKKIKERSAKALKRSVL